VATLDVIDRASPVPYYEQLYAILLDRIQRGVIAAGDRLPSEPELHRQFGLSRQTVRQALELLATNSWAVRVPRRGYFASAPPRDHGWLIEGQGGFLETEVGHRNENVRTRVVSAVRATLPEHAARALQLDLHAEGFVLERVRYLDNELVLFSTNFTPPLVEPVVAGAAGVLSGDSSLTQALRDGGFIAEGSRRVIHALPAPRAIAEELEVGEGAALLRIRSVTWGSTLLPFDYYETWLRSDRLPLELIASAHRPLAAAAGI
jgi:GntR family transcriptional regulator